MLESLPREQSIALLQQYRADLPTKDADAIATMLNDLSVAITLAGNALTHIDSFSNAQGFITELKRAEPPELSLSVDEDSAQQPTEDLAVQINNLGKILHDQNDLPGARQAFELSLTLDQQRFGPDHPASARDLNKLGTVLHDLGDFDGAYQAFEQALSIDEAAFGADHLCVARDANNLGIVLQSVGDLANAYEAFSWALSICQHSLGDRHDYTQVVRAHVLQLEGQR